MRSSRFEALTVARLTSSRAIGPTWYASFFSSNSSAAASHGALVSAGMGFGTNAARVPVVAFSKEAM